MAAAAPGVAGVGHAARARADHVHLLGMECRRRMSPRKCATRDATFRWRSVSVRLTVIVIYVALNALYLHVLGAPRSRRCRAVCSMSSASACSV